MKKNKLKFVQNDNSFAIAYYRYSSHSQNDASIEQQQEQAHIYAETHGFQIIKEYADRAISGTTADRPQYQLMLSEIEKIKPAALILWKTDRLGRDRTEIILAKKRIREAGCQICYVAEAIPEDSCESSFIEAIIEAQAQWYSEQLSKNITRGMLYSAGQGLYLGVNLLGYSHDKNKKYIIDEQTAPVVRQIFNDYAEGKPLAAICDDLNSQGIKTTHDKKFTINSLRWILKNRSYIGEYHFADVVIPDGMPAIVSDELFDKVQKRFKINAHKARASADDPVPRYWLTGKLFCGECGSSMHGTAGTSKRGKRYYYYSCINHYKKKKCILKDVGKEKLENLVVSILDEFLSDSEKLASIAVDIVKYYDKHYGDDSYINALEASLKETETALNNLLKAIEMGIFSETTQARLLELEVQKKNLLAAIETERIKKLAVNDTKRMQEYYEMYKHADFKDPTTRDFVLDYFIEKIFVYSDKLVICCRYDDMKDMEIDLEEVTEATNSVLISYSRFDHFFSQLFQSCENFYFHRLLQLSRQPQS